MANRKIKHRGLILVVDDDENLRTLVMRTLVKSGYTVEGAADGAGALALILESPPVAMLLDQQLPDMTGLQVLRSLAERDANLPFIVMTGQGDERLAVELMKLGAFDYLVKDMDFLDLLPLAVDRLFDTLGTKRELRETEARLLASEEKYRFIVDHTHDMIWMLRSDGMFSFISPSWKVNLGYEPSYLEGQSFRTFVHADDVPVCDSYLRKMFGERNAWPGPQYRVKHADGTWRWHECTMTPVLADDGSFMHFVGVSRDITERKHTEEILALQLAEKETLLREVHHRVKNNIAAIGSFLFIQASSAVGQEAKDAMETALCRVRSMGRLYDALLLSGEYRDVGMKEYLAGIVASIMEIFPEGSALVLDTRIDDCALDPKKAVSVGIILNELLTNVLKYAFKDRDGGAISVLFEMTGTVVTLMVHDDGVGLPSPRDRKSPAAAGSGFGLALVGMLAEQLGGSFVIEGGNGTTSVLRFEP